MTARTCIIFNPMARGNQTRRFRHHIRTLSAEVELRATLGPGGARPLASLAVREGFEIIVGIGGDGTLNEIINGIADIPGGLERTKLGIIPMGTANVFARELGIPFAPNEAWTVIRQARHATLDLLVAEYQADGHPQQRLFFQLGGAGLDARAVELVHPRLKKTLGPLAYVVAGFQALFEHKPAIHVSDGARTTTAELVLLGNGRLYGGDFVLFPDASLKDGLVNLTLFPKVNVPALLHWSYHSLLQQWEGAGYANYREAKKVTLTSPGRVPFELEGEPVGHLPLTISVRPRALRVIC
ncbi:MAG: diacylglycerol kinase family protein [Verrucomicrobiota bacterium]